MEDRITTKKHQIVISIFQNSKIDLSFNLSTETKTLVENKLHIFLVPQVIQLLIPFDYTCIA